MLIFSLKNLNIFISQRADGDFRQTQAVEQFLASRQLAAFIKNHLFEIYKLPKQQLKKDKIPVAFHFYSFCARILPCYRTLKYLN